MIGLLFSIFTWYVLDTDFSTHLLPKVSKKPSKKIHIDLPGPIPVCGDIKVEFFHKDYFSKASKRIICTNLVQFYVYALLVSSITFIL